MTPLIFDIQRFSIHDGPGIRTALFFKGCNLTCPWCQNPESIDLRPEIAFYSERCIGGHDCFDVCPDNAIDLQGVDRIDRDLCTRCGKCAEVCVAGAFRIVGREHNHQEAMAEILRDRDYYANSGGGVTFTGGEPTLHADFILGLLRECKEHGIHTNIETNGYFSWHKFQEMLPYLDLIYFDLKVLDAKTSRAMLGVNSERIMLNAQQLMEAGAPVQFRVPLIPGHTDSKENLNAIIALLHSIGADSVHLLPYHSMGETKAKRVCSPLPELKARPFSTEQLSALQEVFEKQRIKTKVYR
ncbi:MAG: glycyl-radical enzyme activating protein [Flavobacteriales bacterium]|nr:glycyl-radical enzyme activating protein [Flavobacteriales bacterium]